MSTGPTSTTGETPRPASPAPTAEHEGEAGEERITAAEAAARLGVKRETIYAYVSRGLLESRRALDGRTSTFAMTEIERLRRRRDRRGRLDVPVSSAITEVTDGHVAYRGRPLEDLAGTHSFEAVAELLWGGSLGPGNDPDESGWSIDRAVARVVDRAVEALGAGATASDRMMAAIVAAATADPFRDDRTPSGVTTTTRGLVAATVEALPSKTSDDRRDPASVAESRPEPVALRLWRRLTTADRDLWPLLDRTLVCLADHGLATSTLAARLAASTRAGPHAVLLAGLGVVSGPLHGAASRTVHRMFETAARIGPEGAIGETLRGDGRVPGFGHVIHRSHDPRELLLRAALTEAPLDPARMAVVDEVITLARSRITPPANVDLALGTLTFATGMSEDAGEVIFAIARSVGWAAHAMEELDDEPLRFRPVGRYTGPSSPTT